MIQILYSAFSGRDRPAGHLAAVLERDRGGVLCSASCTADDRSSPLISDTVMSPTVLDRSSVQPGNLCSQLHYLFRTRLYMKICFPISECTLSHCVVEKLLVILGIYHLTQHEE